MKKNRAIKLEIMPDDGRWAWWEEYVDNDKNIKIVPTKFGYRLTYSLFTTQEIRIIDVIAFKLEGAKK